MSNVTRLPPCPNSHVDEEIPTRQRDEFELAIGPALNARPTTGNAKRQLHRWLEQYRIHAAPGPV